jgi:hypothetical protein
MQEKETNIQLLVQPNTMAMMPRLFSNNRKSEFVDMDGIVVKGRSEAFSFTQAIETIINGENYENRITVTAGYGHLRPIDDEILSGIFRIFMDQGKLEPYVEDQEIERAKTSRELVRIQQQILKEHINNNNTVYCTRKELENACGKKHGSWPEIKESLDRMMHVVFSDEQINLDSPEKNSENSGLSGEPLLICEFKPYELKGQMTLSKRVIMDFFTGNYFLVDVDWLLNVPKGKARAFLKFINAHLTLSDNNTITFPLREIFFDVFQMPDKIEYVRQNKNRIKKIIISFENLGILDRSLTLSKNSSELSDDFKTFDVFSKHRFQNKETGEWTEEDSVTFKSGEKIIEARKEKEFRKKNPGRIKREMKNIEASLPKVDSDRKKVIFDKIHTIGVDEKYVRFYLAACEKNLHHPIICEKYNRERNCYAKILSIHPQGIKIQRPMIDEEFPTIIEMTYDILEEMLNYFDLFMKYDVKAGNYKSHQPGFMRSIIENNDYNPMKHEDLRVIHQQKKDNDSADQRKVQREKEKRMALEGVKEFSLKLRSILTEYPVSDDIKTASERCVRDMHFEGDVARYFLKGLNLMTKNGDHYLVVHKVYLEKFKTSINHLVSHLKVESFDLRVVTTDEVFDQIDKIGDDEILGSDEMMNTEIDEEFKSLQYNTAVEDMLFKYGLEKEKLDVVKNVIRRVVVKEKLYKTWFSRIQYFEKEGVLYLIVSNKLAIIWIKKSYLDTIHSCFCNDDNLFKDVKLPSQKDLIELHFDDEDNQTFSIDDHKIDTEVAGGSFEIYYEKLMDAESMEEVSGLIQPYLNYFDKQEKKFMKSQLNIFGIQESEELKNILKRVYSLVAT